MPDNGLQPSPNADVLQRKMASEILSISDKETIKGALQAICYGSFIEDWEFHTLMGLSRGEVKKVAENYPDVDERDESMEGCDDSWVAINNALLNLAEFSKGKEEELRTYVSVSTDQLIELLKKWKN